MIVNAPEFQGKRQKTDIESDELIKLYSTNNTVRQYRQVGGNSNIDTFCYGLTQYMRKNSKISAFLMLIIVMF